MLNRFGNIKSNWNFLLFIFVGFSLICFSSKLHSLALFVCVCACVRERERQRILNKKKVIQSSVSTIKLRRTAIKEIDISEVCGEADCAQVVDWLWILVVQQRCVFICIGEYFQFAILIEFDHHFDRLEFIQYVVFVDLGHNITIFTDQMLCIAPSTENWAIQKKIGDC